MRDDGLAGHCMWCYTKKGALPISLVLCSSGVGACELFGLAVDFGCLVGGNLFYTTINHKTFVLTLICM